MKKLRWIMLLSVSLLFLTGLTSVYVFAEDVSGNYEAIILDQADLLSKSEEQQLLSEMEDLLEYGNMIFATVVLNDGANYERHSEDLYYQYYGNEPGVCFQIDMGNRKLTLSASTAMERMLGSEKDSIVDNIYKLATYGDYYGCASECFREIDLVLHDGEIAHDMKHIDNAILALIAGLLINFVIVLITSYKSIPRRKILGAMGNVIDVKRVAVNKGKLTKKYSPRSSGSGSGGSSGGSSGGFSGGSSSHGF